MLDTRAGARALLFELSCVFIVVNCRRGTRLPDELAGGIAAHVRALQGLTVRLLVEEQEVHVALAEHLRAPHFEGIVLGWMDRSRRCRRLRVPNLLLDVLKISRILSTSAFNALLPCRRRKRSAARHARYAHGRLRMHAALAFLKVFPSPSTRAAWARWKVFPQPRGPQTWGHQISTKKTQLLPFDFVCLVSHKKRTHKQTHKQTNKHRKKCNENKNPDDGPSLLWQGFSSSTRYAFFCAARIEGIQQIYVKNVGDFTEKFAKCYKKSENISEFLQKMHAKNFNF